MGNSHTETTHLSDHPLAAPRPRPSHALRPRMQLCGGGQKGLARLHLEGELGQQSTLGGAGLGLRSSGWFWSECFECPNSLEFD